MGKTRDLFKKIRDIKGTFHGRMGTINERNSNDLTVAEEITKRWQKYTEELYKNILMTQVTMMVWSLTQGWTSCSVRLNGAQEALLQTRLMEVKEFQLNYFKFQKMMLLNFCTQYVSKISHANKVMLKILLSLASAVCEPRTSRCTCWVLKRQRNQRSSCQYLLYHRNNKRILEKHIYFCFIAYAKVFVQVTIVTCEISTTVQNS